MIEMFSHSLYVSFQNFCFFRHYMDFLNHFFIFAYDFIVFGGDKRSCLHISYVAEFGYSKGSFKVFMPFFIELSSLFVFDVLFYKFVVFFVYKMSYIGAFPVVRTSDSSIICYSTITLLSYSCYLLTMNFFFYLGLSLDACFIETLITLWSDILSLKSSYLCRIDYGSRSLWTITSILECLFPDYQVFLSHVIIFHPSFHI